MRRFFLAVLILASVVLALTIIPHLTDAGVPITKYLPPHNHSSSATGGPVNHASLSSAGTKTHGAIDSFITSKGQNSGIASLNASGQLVQDLSYYVDLTTDVTGTLPLGNIPDTLIGKRADNIDGYHASQTPGANTVPVLNNFGNLDLPNSGKLDIGNLYPGNVGVEIGNASGTASTVYIDLHTTGSALDYDTRLIFTGGGGAPGGGTMNIQSGNLQSNGSTIWHAGNDGAGSGLDADKWRGLAIVRGIVNADGTIFTGSGFTVNKTGTGVYVITYSTSFSVQPSVVALCRAPSGNARYIHAINSISASSVTIYTFSAPTTPSDVPFDFIAIGLM